MKKVFLVILCLIFCLGCSKIIVPKVTIQQYTDLYSLEDNLYKIWTCVGIENIPLYAYFSQGCLSDVVTCEEIPHTKIYQMTIAQDIKHRLEEKLKTYKPCY